jgi:Flp pilus assembly pilin Flp
MRSILDFLRDDRGQDLVEYTLIVAAIVTLSAVLLNFNREPLEGIWNKGNGLLEQAKEKAS